MKIAIINFGIGNLASVRRMFDGLGAEAYIASHPAALSDADRIVLPGVGAFAEGMDSLRKGGWIDALNEIVIQKEKPLLGICLGMQMLATHGDEGDFSTGLNYIPGQVKRLDKLGCKLRIPHMGWNEVRYTSNDEIFKNIPDSSDFYFVHSYAFTPENNGLLIATAPYDCDITATIRKKNIFGCQFHPEKSSKAGRQFLKNFMEYIPC